VIIWKLGLKIFLALFVDRNLKLKDQNCLNGLFHFQISKLTNFQIDCFIFTKKETE